MPRTASFHPGRHAFRFTGFAGLVATTMLLGACASTDSGGPASTAVATAPAGSTGAGGGGLFGMFKPNPNRGVVTVDSGATLPTEIFLKQGYCPPVQLRTGTESYVVYERGHEDDAAFVRFQGSVGEMARECHAVGPDTLSIKVGIKGRLTAGPKGGAGTETLPLRIAVVKQHGSTVLFSQVFKIPVTITAPQYSGDFQQVIDQINVQLQSADRDLIIYVGFDGGQVKPTS